MKKKSSTTLSLDNYLDEVYRYFIDWKARPLKPGTPFSVQEFCDKYQITLKDTVSFITRPSFHDDLLKATVEWSKSAIPELLHVLYKESTASHSASDIERFVNIVHTLSRKDKEGISNTFNFFGNLKDERYRDIVKREARVLGDGSESPSPELLPAN